MDTALVTALFVVIGLIVWAHGLYFVLLRIAVKAWRRPVSPLSTEEAPFVSIIVPAHNEEAALPEKIANVLALEYPRDRLELIIASDGSTDGTAQVLAQYEDERVRLAAYPSRRGRALVSNDAVIEARGDWLLFTDADTRMASDFLSALLPHLLQDDVGVADGSMICLNKGASPLAENVGFYWKYESALKKAESTLGWLSSTFGACTAVRRSVYHPLGPTEDVDFTTPLDAIKDGYRVVHEPAARVYEVAYSGLRSQFDSRVRMVTKNLPGTLRQLDRHLLRRPLILLALFSHKLLRWATPLLLLAALTLNIALAVQGRFIPLLIAQSIFYLAVIAGGLAQIMDQRLPVASSAFSFGVANAGFLVGIVNSLRRVRITFYEPHHYAKQATPDDDD
jgi:cellulose synthase/poly-beta-1,6-N-acetylglucosamine synthase-like glycosyltransferase